MMRLPIAVLFVTAIGCAFSVLVFYTGERDSVVPERPVVKVARPPRATIAPPIDVPPVSAPPTPSPHSLTDAPPPLPPAPSAALPAAGPPLLYGVAAPGLPLECENATGCRPRDAIAVDVVYEVVDSGNSGHQYFVEHEWPLWMRRAEANATRVALEDSRDVIDIHRRPDALLLLSLRSLAQHAVCPGGDCCAARERTRLAVGRVLLVVPSAMHVPPWLIPWFEGMRGQGECAPALEVATHADLVAALGLDELRVLPTYNTFAVQSMAPGLRAGGGARFAIHVPASTIFRGDVTWADFFEAFRRGETEVVLPRPIASLSRGAGGLATPEAALSAVGDAPAAAEHGAADAARQLRPSERRLAHNLRLLRAELPELQLADMPPSLRALDASPSVHVLDYTLMEAMRSSPRALGQALRAASAVRSPAVAAQAMPLYLHRHMVAASRWALERMGFTPTAAAPGAPAAPWGVLLRFDTAAAFEELWRAWVGDADPGQAEARPAARTIPFAVFADHCGDAEVDTARAQINGFLRAQLSAPGATLAALSPWEHAGAPLWPFAVASTSDSSVTMPPPSVPPMQAANATPQLSAAGPTIEPVSVLIAPDSASVLSFPCTPGRMRSKTGFVPRSSVLVDSMPLLHGVDDDRARGDLELRGSLEHAVNDMCWRSHAEGNSTFTPQIIDAQARAAFREPEVAIARGENASIVVTVDVVYTYVSDRAVKWLEELTKFQIDHGLPVRVSRFRDWGELKYSLRSVYAHLCDDGDCCGTRSGVRVGTIYIVTSTAEHIPSWMRNFTLGPRPGSGGAAERAAERCVPELRVITHDMIFPGAGNNPELGEHRRDEEELGQYLPTYQSMSIETCLHRIPNLSRYFLYLNNDFMFGDKIVLTDLFRPRFRVPQPRGASGGARVTLEELELELEPLVFGEGSYGGISGFTSSRCDAVKRQPDPVPPDAALWRAGAAHLGVHCAAHAHRNITRTALECRDMSALNEWIRTLFFNAAVVLDRLDGLDLFTRYPHAPMLLERNLLRQLLEVEFRDLTWLTRKGKLRQTTHIAAVFMYRMYALAQRRARAAARGGASRSLCAAPPRINGRRSAHEFHLWAVKDFFRVNDAHILHFHMIRTHEQITSLIDQYRSGSLLRMKLLAINDEVHIPVNSTFMEAFSTLLNIAIGEAAPSPWEMRV